MSAMQSSEQSTIRQIEPLNEAARADAHAFVLREEARYAQAIEQAAAHVMALPVGRRIVLQCGPSSAGKTTTAEKLANALRQGGTETVVISLDNFYKGREQAPRLPDGNFDYESPKALDLSLLKRCIEELLTVGHTGLPVYDFESGSQKTVRQPLTLSENAAVIFEGIHAFDPSLDVLSDDEASHVVRLFVNCRSRFSLDGETLLSRRDIRLCRRLLRDERFRNSSFENTMRMWQQVANAETTYIFPHSDLADWVVDTTIGYEPCVLAPRLLPRFSELYGTPFEETARRLEQALAHFTALPEELVPADSLLREFLGPKVH
ncbi:MAG: nucleoside kinase [Clostridia bacterium]|nr:nucleoside kinase [Clostridia bacterium]